EDELVSHLLMVHGLHPDDLRLRVEAALESARPNLRSHGGDVELISIESAAVHLRFRGSCQGCPSSAVTLRSTVEDAIRAAAPEIEHIDMQDAADSAPDTPLVRLSRARSNAEATTAGTRS